MTKFTPGNLYQLIVPTFMSKLNEMEKYVGCAGAEIPCQAILMFLYEDDHMFYFLYEKTIWRYSRPPYFSSALVLVCK